MRVLLAPLALAGLGSAVLDELMGKETMDFMGREVKTCGLEAMMELGKNADCFSYEKQQCINGKGKGRCEWGASIMDTCDKIIVKEWCGVPYKGETCYLDGGPCEKDTKMFGEGNAIMCMGEDCPKEMDGFDIVDPDMMQCPFRCKPDDEKCPCSDESPCKDIDPMEDDIKTYNGGKCLMNLNQYCCADDKSRMDPGCAFVVHELKVDLRCEIKKPEDDECPFMCSGKEKCPCNEGLCMGVNPEKDNIKEYNGGRCYRSLQGYCCQMAPKDPACESAKNMVDLMCKGDEGKKPMPTKFMDQDGNQIEMCTMDVMKQLNEENGECFKMQEDPKACNANDRCQYGAPIMDSCGRFIIQKACNPMLAGIPNDACMFQAGKCKEDMEKSPMRMMCLGDNCPLKVEGFKSFETIMDMGGGGEECPFKCGPQDEGCPCSEKSPCMHFDAEKHELMTYKDGACHEEVTSYCCGRGKGEMNCSKEFFEEFGATLSCAVPKITNIDALQNYCKSQTGAACKECGGKFKKEKCNKKGKCKPASCKGPSKVTKKTCKRAGETLCGMIQGCTFAKGKCTGTPFKN